MQAVHAHHSFGAVAWRHRSVERSLTATPTARSDGLESEPPCRYRQTAVPSPCGALCCNSGGLEFGGNPPLETVAADSSRRIVRPALAVWAVASAGYKDRRGMAAARTVREQIVRQVGATVSSWLDLTVVSERCVESEHVLDALVSGLVAVAAAVALLHQRMNGPPLSSKAGSTRPPHRCPPCGSCRCGCASATASWGTAVTVLDEHIDWHTRRHHARRAARRVVPSGRRSHRGEGGRPDGLAAAQPTSSLATTPA